MNRVSAFGLLIMAIVSFTNLFGTNIAGISVFAGVTFFFVNKVSEKQKYSGSGLDVREIGANLRDRKIWVWMVLPLLMDFFAMLLSRMLVPEYTTYVLTRTSGFVSLDTNIPFLVIQLAVLALGEEIAWRAFFQQQLLKALPISPTLIVSSILFALGHITVGSFIVVAYNVFFVFINSILYGIIFHKTNNAWTSAISHFSANLFSIIVLLSL
jgi:membrane protease YdiL (CAAX protease family)